MTADPTASTAFSTQFNGICPLYAGTVLIERAEILVFLDLDAEFETVNRERPGREEDGLNESVLRQFRVRDMAIVDYLDNILSTVTEASAGNLYHCRKKVATQYFNSRVHVT